MVKFLKSFLDVGVKKTTHRPTIHKDFYSRIEEVNQKHYAIAFKNFYRFCFTWSLFVTSYFALQQVFSERTSNYLWSGIIYISVFSSFIFGIFIRQNDLILKNISKPFYFCLTIFSLFLLPLTQWMFLMVSEYGNVAALHTLNAIPYAMFMTLYYFLPNWKLTIIASFFSFCFYLSHYVVALDSTWIFIANDGKMISGTISPRWIIQTTVGFIVFMLFTIKEVKRKEEKNRGIREGFLHKSIAGTHLKLMNLNTNNFYGNGRWKIKTRVQFADSIHGADFVTITESGNKVYVAVGDVVGHGLEVSSGAFLASACIKSLSIAQAHPIVIMNTVNKILYNFDEQEGGETFLELLVLKQNGEVEILGDSAGETLVQGVQIYNRNTLLGKDEEEIILEPKFFKLKKFDVIHVSTDGWSTKDHYDDQTAVWIEYLGDDNASNN